VNASLAIDCGDLPLGGGALALIRPALERLEPGGVLAIRSSNPTLREDLAGWCRLERHRLLDGDELLVERGRYGVLLQTSPPSVNAFSMVGAAAIG
jgi:TusA-related sulfurtransferase